MKRDQYNMPNPEIRCLKINTSRFRRDLFRQTKREMEKEFGEMSDAQALEYLCVTYQIMRQNELEHRPNKKTSGKNK